MRHEFVQRVVGRPPDEILSALASLYETDYPNQAIELWIAAFKLDAQAIYAYRAGKTLMALGRYEEAGEQLALNLALFTDHMPSRFCLAECLAQVNKFGEALEEVDIVVAKQPQNAAAQSLKLHLLVLMQRYEEALSFAAHYNGTGSRADMLATLIASSQVRTLPPESEMTPAIRKQLYSISKEVPCSDRWLEKVKRFLLGSPP